jgi:hypothetical protein
MIIFSWIEVMPERIGKEGIMEHVMKEKLQSVQVAKVQEFRNVAGYPLFVEARVVVDHLVLKEAIEQELVVIREVDEGGHVPELVVVNNADKPLLILDGEELFGAKQNRVLNTTVLLKKKSATIIPVSCTEQGRWRYESKTFRDSGYIMSPRVRGVKKQVIAGDISIDRGLPVVTRGLSGMASTSRPSMRRSSPQPVPCETSTRPGRPMWVTMSSTSRAWTGSRVSSLPLGGAWWAWIWSLMGAPMRCCTASS